MEHDLSITNIGQRISQWSADLWHMLSGSGLKHRIVCAAVFAVCTILYVWLLVPSTRISDIIYPGVSVEMRTVPAMSVFETGVSPGMTVSQTIVGSGERMDSVSVRFAFGHDGKPGTYRITVLSPDGDLMATDEFTTEGRVSPSAESVHLGGAELRDGDEYQFVLSSSEDNEQTLLVPVIADDDWYTYPHLRMDDESVNEVLLLSLVTQVDSGPAWAVAWTLIAAICAAIMMWRAPLAVNALILILIFGLTFCFLTPINDSPDETAHMARTFRMADGEWLGISDNGETVSELYSGSSGQTAWRNDLRGISWDDKPALGDAGEDLLFTGHLPQAAGVMLGRLLGLDLAGIYYTGRLLNMLFYSICAYFAVRMAPRFRLYLAVFSIMPMQIAVCSTYSSDGCIYGLAILAAGWFIRMYYDPSVKIGFRTLAVFAVLMALICLKKYWAAPLGLLPLAIPASRFVRRSAKMWGIAVGVCAFAAALAALWYTEVSGMPGVVSALAQDADITGQVQFMLSSPVQSARIIAGSLASGLGNDLAQLFIFGRLTARTPALVVMLYISFLAVAAFSTTRYQHDAAYTVGNTPVHAGTRTWVLCIMLATLIAIYVVNYVTGTPVGMNTVIGVQGRYLIPVLAYLPFLAFDAWPLVTTSVYMRSRTVCGLIGALMLMMSVMSLCFYAL